MENDIDSEMPNSLYPTLHATSLIEKLLEQLGLTTCSLTDTVRAVGQGLHHQNWMVRLEAVRSLGVLGEQAKPVLMRMVHDDNECVRLLAQYELQRLALIESSPSIPIEHRLPEVVSPPEVHNLEQLSREKVQAKGSEKQKSRYTITWREILEVLLEDPSAMEKITKLLHVSSETLMNWIHSKKKLDFRILQQFLDAFPDDYDALLELIQREFPHFVPIRLADGEASREILEPFHDRLSERYSLPALRFWSTCQLVLQQAMQQLNPYRTIMICTPPSSEEKVRSLHGYIGLGSSAWTENWYQQPLFLGSDSLSGYAATVGSIQVVQDLKLDLKGISRYNIDDMRSVLVAPILSSKKCAGCLYIASTSPNYFGSRRLELVEQYVECLASAFSPEEFYPLEQIQLSLLPYKIQNAYFKQIRQSKQNIIMNTSITNQCKQNKWKNIEDELISFTRKQMENLQTRYSSFQPIVELETPQARSQVEAELFILLSAMSSTEKRWYLPA